MDTAQDPLIGLAYNSSTPAFLRENLDAVDYVEVPFELLSHDPSVFGVRDLKPLVLHCASLSLAGTVKPTKRTFSAIRDWCRMTETPWVGEHLAYITADRSRIRDGATEYAAGEPYNIGYTVSPPMNFESVRTVVQAVNRAEDALGMPLLIENSPLYFAAPGSRMSQTQFIGEICAKTDVGLLLDLSHFYITSRTMNFDSRQEILSLPLERVVEIHISGVDLQSGIHWDNHAKKAPAEVYDLLSLALTRAQVKAITLEYNWSSRFPPSVLLEEIRHTRQAVATAVARQQRI